MEHFLNNHYDFSVFSLNFSSAGIKGPFTASKAKKICARGALSLEGGGGVVG